MEFILASSSPRRQQLLSLTGLRFKVIVSQVEEDNAKDMPPQELAIAHAREKAFDVSKHVCGDDIIIGADTIVVLDGKVFGKPTDKNDAAEMLRALAGREHIVISGVAVVKGQQFFTGYSSTRVKFRQLSPKQIRNYIATGEPMDKAGAYAIQGRGSLLVEKIDGCYNNVVGLPLVTLAELLNMAGVELL